MTERIINIAKDLAGANVDREGTRLPPYLVHFKWTEIGFSANHKSSCLGAECKGCCDWLMDKFSLSEYQD
jgi:hypothetical protein